MDETELLVGKYLVSRGYADIQFEPIPNETPDFVYESSNAVEVRRLNRNYFVDDLATGYERTFIPIHKAVRKLLSEHKNPNKEQCWIVSISFKRPVDWKHEKKEAKKAIREFAKSNSKNEGVIYSSLNESFSLAVRAANEVYEQIMVPGGIDDQDSCGLLIQDMERNIVHCIEEKTQKISRNKSKYATWSLALVDCIGYGLDEFEQSLFVDQVQLDHEWDSVVLIDPRDHANWFTV